MTEEERIGYWRRRHEADPGSRAFVPLADLYLARGRTAEALDLLEAGLARQPSYLAAWLIKARCHLRQGEGAEARRALGEARRLDPDNLVALRLLADVAGTEGRTDERERLLRRLVRLDPADERARRELEALPPAGEAVVPAAGPAPAPAPASPPVPVEAPAAGAVPPPGQPPREAAAEPGGEAEERTPQATATLTLARIYRAQGHPRRALEVLRKILGQQPDRQDIQAEITALEAELAAEAAAGPAPARGPKEPPYPAPGRRESRSHFEQWLTGLAGPRGDDRDEARPG